MLRKRLFDLLMCFFLFIIFIEELRRGLRGFIYGKEDLNEGSGRGNREKIIY